MLCKRTRCLSFVYFNFLFVLLFCFRGPCCSSKTLNKGKGNRVLILVWEGPAGEPKDLFTAQDPGEVNHENVINQDPRSDCWGLPRGLLITSSTHCVDGRNDSFSGIGGDRQGTPSC